MPLKLSRIALSSLLATALVVAPMPVVMTQAKTPETRSHELSVSRGQTEKITSSDDKVSIVGATWAGNTGLEKVEYRTQEKNGQWGGWQELPRDDADGPDEGTAEASVATYGTEPLVVPEDTAIEIRTDQKSQIFVAETDATPVGSPAGSVVSPAPAHAAGKSQIGGFSYTPRKAWGAKSPRKGCPVETTKTNKAVVIHHTAGSNRYSRSDVPAIMRGIQNYHMNGRGWCDIGYNMTVDKWGNIYEARSGGLTTAVIGAHAMGFNTGTFGVSVLGTYNKPVSSDVISSLQNIVNWQAQLWGYDPTGTVKLKSRGGPKYKKGTVRELPRVFGHKDVGNTDCPGRGLYGQLKQIRVKKTVKTDAPFVTKSIRKYYEQHYLVTGAPRKTRGKTGKGYYQYFAKGAVYHSDRGVYFTAFNSSIRKVWAKHDYARGRLGFPTSNVYTYGKGKAQNFEGGTIVQSSQGTFSITGAIKTNWNRSKSTLKSPISSKRTMGGKKPGAYQLFENGSISWSKKTGARYATGTIRKEWVKRGGINSRLGYPTSNPYKIKNGYKQNFQGGWIVKTKRGASVTWRK